MRDRSSRDITKIATQSEFKLEGTDDITVSSPKFHQDLNLVVFDAPEVNDSV